MAAHVAHMVTRLTLIVAPVARIISHALGECHRSNSNQKDHCKKGYEDLFVSAMNHVIHLFSESLVINSCYDCPCYRYIQNRIEKGRRKFCDLRQASNFEKDFGLLKLEVSLKIKLGFIKN
jgi:hypothetical protein